MARRLLRDAELNTSDRDGRMVQHRPDAARLLSLGADLMVTVMR